MAKYKKMMPPRNTIIRGQDHLLAYITPEEAALLKARGGSGEPGPMGIPQFGYGDDDGNGYGDGDSDTGGMGSGDSDTGGFGGGGYGEDPGFDGGGGGSAQNDRSGGPSSAGRGGGRASAGMSSSRGFSGGDGNGIDFDTELDVSGLLGSALSGLSNEQVNKAVNSARSILGMSPSRSQAQFGTTEFAGLTEDAAKGLIGSGQASQQAMDIQSSLASQKAAEIAALEQLNRDLYDLSRREQIAKSLPGILGQISLNNVRNIAAAMSGYPPGLLEGLNFSSKTIGSGLDPSSLAGLQSRGIRGATGKDPFGRETTGIVGFRDAYGNLSYGRDPNEDATFGGDQETVKPVDPVTGQCDEGYIFDEDLQACRLDTRSSMGDQPSLPQVPFEPGGYARMGLLDVSPTGLPRFQQQYGAGFGTPQDFAAANLAFRRRGATYPEYFQRPPQLSGYTLLS